MDENCKMTLKNFISLTKKYNIPDDALIMSDSGWECCATDCAGVFYSKKFNKIVLTQKFYVVDKCMYSSDHYAKSEDFIELI